MSGWYDKIYNGLSDCHKFFKRIAIVFRIIADIAFWISYFCCSIWAIVVAVKTESFTVFLSLFFLMLISVLLGYFGMIFGCHILYSWGEKIEHTKKQTEFLKILALEKNKNE